MTTYDPRLRTRAYRKLRLQIIDRDLGLCQIRGPRCTRYATEVDHIVARADGGPMFDPTNLRAACHQCNAGLAARRTNIMRRYRTSVPTYETRL